MPDDSTAAMLGPEFVTSAEARVRGSQEVLDAEKAIGAAPDETRRRVRSLMSENPDDCRSTDLCWVQRLCDGTAS